MAASGCFLQQLLLRVEELFDAAGRIVHHFEHAVAGEGRFLGCGLHFDQAAVFCHDDVHVDFSLRVFFISEVEEDCVFNDADAGGGDELLERGFRQGPAFDHAVEGDGERGASSGDGRGACAAVGLEDIAIENDHALAEGLEVDDGAQGAADEALDFVGAASDLSALGFARGAGEGGAGEHAVFGCDPATTAVSQPCRDALFHCGVAEDAGVAEFDENGAFGCADVMRDEADGAERVGGAVAGAEEGRWLEGHRFIVSKGRGCAERLIPVLGLERSGSEMGLV
jgi:hypothetical protein